MKAILISIKPKWVAKILNGEKTIEIRKTMPKCDLPIDVYIYCTWGTGKYNQMMKQFGEYHFNKHIGGYYGFNGKVVAKFTLNKVEEIFGYPYEPYCCDSDLFFETNSLRPNKLFEKSCLNHEELENYLNDVSPYGYAWHIDNLEIFDKPKELSEFKHYNKPNCDNCPYSYSENCDYHREIGCEGIPLTKAPQSWCYVEE